MHHPIRSAPTADLPTILPKPPPNQAQSMPLPTIPPTAAPKVSLLTESQGCPPINGLTSHSHPVYELIQPSLRQRKQGCLVALLLKPHAPLLRFASLFATSHETAGDGQSTMTIARYEEGRAESESSYSYGGRKVARVSSPRSYWLVCMKYSLISSLQSCSASYRDER